MSSSVIPVVMLAASLIPLPASAAEKAKRPDFAAVKSTVQQSLATRKGYRANDLISRGDVERALKQVDKLGWKVADAKTIQQQFLTDNDDLVRRLRTRRGLPFMRKLSGTPQTYDRLDRLRRLPYGPRRIRELIANPGGYTMILYMAGTRGGKNLGKYLSRTQQGKRFNKKTGRLYTEKDLLKRLQASYEAARKSDKSRSKAKPRK